MNSKEHTGRLERFFVRFPSLFAALVLFMSAAPLFSADPAATTDSGQKYIIGIKGSYQETYVGTTPVGRGQSMRGSDNANAFSTSGGSILFMSTPAPMLSHLGYSGYVDFNAYNRNENGKTFSVGRADLGVGIYLTSDDLRQGNVGFYLAVIGTGSALHLKGDFQTPLSNSLYQYYLTEQAAARAAGRTSPTDSLDRIDVLTLSRQQQGRLSKDRTNAYLAYKAGVISRNQFMAADMYYGAPTDASLLLLQGAGGASLEDQHKNYAANLDVSRRKGDFTGLPVAFEIGYMGGNFLVQYTSELSEKFTAKGDSVYMERHTLKVGVYVKL